jgi:hypothetical protein
MVDLMELPKSRVNATMLAQFIDRPVCFVGRLEKVRGLVVLGSPMCSQREGPCDHQGGGFRVNNRGWRAESLRPSLPSRLLYLARGEFSHSLAITLPFWSFFYCAEEKGF